MSIVKKVLFGEFLKPYRIEHIVEDKKIYKQVTISKYDGVSFRGEKIGKNIGRKRQFIIDLNIHPNTVLFTRQGILDGSIGLAPIDVDKCIVTENMPMMSVDTNLIEIEYLKKLLVSRYLIDKIKKLNIVGSAQKSIHERDFLSIEIQLPPKCFQKKLANKFKSMDKEHQFLVYEIAHQKNLLKKLRQQILQEAIEGELTADWRAQHPDVEPASKLLERIAAEKAELIKSKKIKSQKQLPKISETEKPFNLPKGWEWCQLGDICFIQYGKGLKKSETKMTGRYPVYASNGIVGYYNQCLTDRRAIILGRKGSAGAIQITKNGSWTTDVAYFVEELSSLDFKYMILLFKSLNLNKLSKGIKPGLNRYEAYCLPIPISSTDEQKAIVAKVEKLLAMCDELEIQINANETHAEQLMQAVLKEAFTQNN